MKMDGINVLRHADQLVEFHCNLYWGALKDGDRQGQAASAGMLCIAFSAMGNAPLAKKWAEAFMTDINAASPEDQSLPGSV